MKLNYKEKALVAFITLLIGCATVSQTGRRQIMMVSPEEEVQMGFDSFAQIKANSKIIKGTTAALQVERVGKKIAAVSGQSYDWEFILISDPQVNAFCLPGGKVAVYTGLLPVAVDDTGLAVVMGHEIAHAIARHGAERMSQDSLLNLGGQILGATTSNANILNAYGIGSNVGFALPYSRKHETEADDIGLILMAKAGYNPSKAVDFWQRMSAGGSSGTPAILSTHPSDTRRIQNIQKEMPTAMQYYRAAGGR